MLRIKYNTQTLACKQKQRWGSKFGLSRGRGIQATWERRRDGKAFHLVSLRLARRLGTQIKLLIDWFSCHSDSIRERKNVKGQNDRAVLFGFGLSVAFLVYEKLCNNPEVLFKFLFLFNLHSTSWKNMLTLFMKLPGINKRIMKKNTTTIVFPAGVSTTDLQISAKNWGKKYIQLDIKKLIRC